MRGDFINGRQFFLKENDYSRSLYSQHNGFRDISARILSDHFANVEAQVLRTVENEKGDNCFGF